MVVFPGPPFWLPTTMIMLPSYFHSAITAIAFQ
jgi:hypothetical protein